MFFLIIAQCFFLDMFTFRRMSVITDFLANHPFVYLIINKNLNNNGTAVINFMGKLISII